jgi:branched-chain amino acid aminotransferase
MKAESATHGYTETLALRPSGLVSEGSGQNPFLVGEGVLFTPFLDGTSLRRITRDAVLRPAQDLGIPTRRRHVPRESLYICDDLFFTGTASEITPIRSVDRNPVGASRGGGAGGAGSIIRAVQEDFMAVVTGRAEDPHGWLTEVG